MALLCTQRLHLAEEAFLMKLAARAASAPLSKPNTPAYLRPTTCASTKLRLMPLSAMACAIAWPSPGELAYAGDIASVNPKTPDFSAHLEFL